MIFFSKSDRKTTDNDRIGWKVASRKKKNRERKQGISTTTSSITHTLFPEEKK